MTSNLTFVSTLLIALISSEIPVSSGIRLCGVKLVKFLGKMCGHRYHSSMWGHKGGLRAQFFYTPTHRPGIVDECCFHTCSYSTLLSYCDKAEGLAPTPPMQGGGVSKTKKNEAKGLQRKTKHQKSQEESVTGRLTEKGQKRFSPLHYILKEMRRLRSSKQGETILS